MLNKWAERQNIPLSEVAAHVTPKATKKAPALQWATSRAFLTTGSFSEFIRHEKVKSAPGFRSQASMLSMVAGGPITGEIFRLEDYPRWTKPLGSRLGLEFSLPHANQSGLRPADPQAISSEDRAFIEGTFEKDYAAFGYDRPVPLPLA
jgi:hypothetical protein